MIFLDLIHNIALLVALSAILPLVAYRPGSRTVHGRIVAGVLFGGVVLLGMATPVTLGTGVIFDGRSIVLCAAGVVGGPLVAGTAAAMAIAYRIFLGGPGAIVGVSVILESAALGVGFFYMRRNRVDPPRVGQLLVLGFLVHAVMIALFSQLPGGLTAPLMRQIVAVSLTVYPLATAAVCRFLFEAEARAAMRVALAASEEQLALAIDASGIGLWDWKIDTSALAVNDRWAQLVGHTAREFAPLTYETWISFVHPDDLTEAERAMRRCFSGDTPYYACEVRMRHKDGHWVWVAMRGRVTERDGADQPARVTGTSIDITERKAAEAALRDSNALKEQMVMDVSEAMGRIVEARDPYTQGHQQRVAKVARLIAERMGLPETDVEGIEMAGLLHDVGKLRVPAEILTKPGAISEAELALIKEHPAQGHDILGSITFPWPIADWVRQHHERMDGSGYPDGLSGDQIPMAARILAVADVLEAMASHRPYRPALGIDAAIAELRDNPEKYDRAVVAACVALHDDGLMRL